MRQTMAIQAARPIAGSALEAGIRHEVAGMVLAAGARTPDSGSSLPESPGGVEPIEIDPLQKKSPLFKALIERIKTARLPFEKKQELIRMVARLFSAAGQRGGGPDLDAIKKIYALIELMEQTEKHELDPGELAAHSRKIDEMVYGYLAEEERSGQADQVFTRVHSLLNAYRRTGPQEAAWQLQETSRDAA